MMTIVLDGWDRSSLDQLIAAIQSGARPKGGVSTETGDIPSLGGENLTLSGRVKLNDVKLIPSEFYKRMSKGHLEKDDVLINKDGAQTGKVGCYEVDLSPACINEHLFLLRGQKNRIIQKYLYYSLLSQPGQYQIRSQISGSAQPGLKSNFIRGLIVDLPRSLTEQRKIAHILSMIDRAIEQTEALIAKQQSIKSGLMYDLLTRGVDEQGNLRSEKTHQFKDSLLGKIPVEWEVISIKTVLKCNPKNGYSPIESPDWNGIYMLGLGCLTPEGFQPKQLKYAPYEDMRIETARLADGDFLISRANTRELVGLVGIFKDIGELCIYPDLIMRLQFCPTVIPEYMEQLFSSSIIRQQIKNAATGTSESMVKISASIIKQLIFPKPPIAEQSRIKSIIKKINSSMHELKTSHYKLRALKTALMQDLLTGRKRVTALLHEKEMINA
ncbi:MAG: restriction endonuclease subunit S [Chlamydiales bacterium]